jgi:hypothetical protein
MSDLPQDDEQPVQGDEQPLHPVLEAFKDSFTTPLSKGWAEDAANRVQGFLDRQHIADQANAAADAFTNNLHNTKSQMTSMAEENPHTTSLALDLVDPLIHGMTAAHPDLSGEDRDNARDGLISHFKSEIAFAGVQGFANTDKGAADRALETYGVHLSDGQKDQLRGYIDTMDRARQGDFAGESLQQARSAHLNSNYEALGYVSALSGPGGEMRFEPGWLQGVTTNPKVIPPMKAALSDAYERLTTTGNVPSDPGALESTIKGLASGTHQLGDVVSQIGDKLSTHDAGFIASLAERPESQRFLKAMSESLDHARSYLVPDATDIAGNAAMQSYTKYLVDRMQNGYSLHPKDDNFYLPQPKDEHPLDRFKVAEAINPHAMAPGSIPSFAGPHPDTRGDANYSRPASPMAPAGSSSHTGKVGARSLRDIFGGLA